MAKFSQACIDTAKQALAHFSNDELKEYATRVFARARAPEYQNLKPGAAMQRAISDINESAKRELFEQAAIKANNTTKFAKLAALIKDGKANLKELLIRRYKNLANNIESKQKTARNKLYDSFFKDLNPMEYNYIFSGKNDDDIAAALDGKESTPMAKKIAEKQQKYIDTRNADMVTSNALPLDFISKDRHLRLMHDPSKILSGGRSLINAAMRTAKYTTSEARELWKSFIKDRVDLEKTFADTKAIGIDGTVNMNEVDNMLDVIYSNITTSKSDIFTKSIVANDRAAQAKKARMFFVWKDHSSFLDYNKKYGKGTYGNALMNDIQASANKIGMAQIFGDSPANMYLDLKAAQLKADPKSEGWFRQADIFYKGRTGESDIVVSPSSAAIHSSIRAFSGMARLGSLAIQGMSDISGAITFGARWGFGYWGSYLNAWRGLFNVMPNAERKYIAGLYKANFDAHLGYIGRYVDATNLGEISSKVTTGFWKVTGTHALDNGNKLSPMASMAKNLGNLSTTKFDDLPAALRRQFDKFGLTPDEWNMLRTKTGTHGFFSTDNVDALTPGDLKKLYGEGGINAKDDLYHKIYSMFDVASENAYLQPNAFTKAWMTFGTEAGTNHGEFLRYVMQFKGYSISFIDRVLYQGFRDAVGAQAKLGYFLQLFMATLPISVASTYMGYLAENKTMPDWNSMSIPQRYYYAAQILAPSMSMATKIFNPNTQGSDKVMELFNGASMKTAGDALAGAIQMVEGDPQKALKSFGKAGQGLSPLGSLPIISPYMEYAFGQQPHLEPGQKQIFGN